MSLRERKKQQSRDDILNAASELINSRGYQDAKMRDIAEAANVSYQTLYNYFPNKALIVEALLHQDVEDTYVVVEAAIAEHRGNLLEILNAVNKIRLDTIAHRDRELWREVVIEYCRRSDGIQALIKMVGTRAHVRLGQLMREAQDADRLDASVDTDILTDTVLGLIETAVLRYILEPTLSKAELLQTLRSQMELVVTPYLR